MGTTLPRHIIEILPSLRKWCAFRERSVEEARRKITAYLPSLAGEEKENILTLLREEGLVDDLRFAMLYAHSKLHQNQWGKLKIRTGLARAGITAETAGRALGKIDEEEYHDILISLLHTKAASIRFDGSLKARHKLYQYLAGKGFEPDLIIRQIDLLSKNVSDED